MDRQFVQMSLQLRHTSRCDPQTSQDSVSGLEPSPVPEGVREELDGVGLPLLDTPQHMRRLPLALVRLLVDVTGHLERPTS